MNEKNKNTRKIEIFSETFFWQKKKKIYQDGSKNLILIIFFCQKKKSKYQGGKNAYLRRGNISGSKIKYQLEMSFSKISFWATKDNDNEALIEQKFFSMASTLVDGR